MTSNLKEEIIDLIRKLPEDATILEKYGKKKK